LRETARSAIEALGPFLAEHETPLTVEIDGEPLFVVGDAARLQQIQANLLSNASKYSPQGSNVRFELTRVGSEAMIRVTDHGQGIESDMLARIFDLFVQGNQPLARTDGGLGPLSGYGQDSDVQASLEAGFDEHLTKPPDPARLEALLRG
jgi:signal transduction histidine kinase